MKAPETLYRTDKGELVAEGHKDAAFLVANKGNFVPPEVVKRYKLNERWAKEKGTEGAEETDSPASKTLRHATTVKPEDETPRDTRAIPSKTLHKRSE